MKSLSSELLYSHRIETVIKLISKNDVWKREKYKMKRGLNIPHLGSLVLNLN